MDDFTSDDWKLLVTALVTKLGGDVWVTSDDCRRAVVDMDRMNVAGHGIPPRFRAKIDQPPILGEVVEDALVLRDRGRLHDN